MNNQIKDLAKVLRSVNSSRRDSASNVIEEYSERTAHSARSGRHAEKMDDRCCTERVWYRNTSTRKCSKLSKPSWARSSFRVIMRERSELSVPSNTATAKGVSSVGRAFPTLVFRKSQATSMSCSNGINSDQGPWVGRPTSSSRSSWGIFQWEESGWNQTSPHAVRIIFLIPDVAPADERVLHNLYRLVMALEVMLEINN